MKILLVSATKFEIAPLLKKKKKGLDVLITGPGIANTAYALGKTLARKRYDLAINAGIAGSFRKNIPLGTVVNVASDRFSDFGAEDGNRFLTAKEINLVGSSEWRGKLAIASKASRFVVGNSKYQFKLPKVKGITVNTVHGNNSSIKKVVKKFYPDVESMEGAAFFMACQTEKVPCLQVRAVSNYVERRNKKKWKIALAVKNLNSFLEELLEVVFSS